jgi:antitoxin component YwqK of YwqJK toxin-antitoxin module
VTDGRRPEPGPDGRNRLDDQGRRTGTWEETFADGTLSGIVEYLDGEKHGTCTYWYRSGQLKATGAMERGRFTGHWEWWRENGQPLQRGEFVDGEQHGLWQRHHDNGRLWDEGHWDHGTRSGPWRYYDTEGELVRKTNHRGRRSD